MEFDLFVVIYKLPAEHTKRGSTERDRNRQVIRQHYRTDGGKLSSVVYVAETSSGSF